VEVKSVCQLSCKVSKPHWVLRLLADCWTGDVPSSMFNSVVFIFREIMWSRTKSSCGWSLLLHTKLKWCGPWKTTGCSLIWYSSDPSTLYACLPSSHNFRYNLHNLCVLVTSVDKHFSNILSVTWYISFIQYQWPGIYTWDQQLGWEHYRKYMEAWYYNWITTLYL